MTIWNVDELVAVEERFSVSGGQPGASPLTKAARRRYTSRFIKTVEEQLEVRIDRDDVRLEFDDEGCLARWMPSVLDVQLFGGIRDGELRVLPALADDYEVPDVIFDLPVPNAPEGTVEEWRCFGWSERTRRWVFTSLPGLGADDDDNGDELAAEA